MSWAKGHSSLTENSTAPTIDRCINCGDHEEVQATITMEFGEGNYNTGLFVGSVISCIEHHELLGFNL